MGSQLEWQERYNTGVDLIDDAHKKLFNIMGKLLSNSKKKDKVQWVCQEGIKFFKNYTVKHFEEEEEYMKSIGYNGYDIHKRLHDNFRDKTLPTLEKELEQSQYSENAVSHFLSVCTGWLLSHTLTEDHAIVGKAASRWENLLPEEEHTAMGQALIQILYDVFRLDSKVISENYRGERFAKGIYYSLRYHTAHGDKWEILLVFEEQLLINTVGEMMGFRFDRINSTIINAARYMSQQFLENVREHFPSVDLCELKAENLLTYAQFRKEFDRQPPRCSLLFDTGEGYFAFCAVAPNTFSNNLGTSLKEETAMDNIREYLINNKTSKKKKILVVDDSSMMRQTMINLLGNDYQIEPADSGLTAIRCITLNRPDLVLLDYEMPICDGRQVLEMIRSEKDFANIPVIFLTGRGDAESVKKVMALKPTGYLLKTLPPAEIKKEIDIFFDKNPE